MMSRTKPIIKKREKKISKNNHLYIYIEICGKIKYCDTRVVFVDSVL